MGTGTNVTANSARSRSRGATQRLGPRFGRGRIDRARPPAQAGTGIGFPRAPRVSDGVTPIRIAVALVTRPDGKTLLVRKRGTVTFIQPGGKIEPDETPAAAVCREVSEELGIVLDPAALQYLGRFEDVAVNEPGTVVAEAYRVAIDVPVSAAAEIEELAWIDPADSGGRTIAPMSRDQLIPLLLPRAVR